MITTNELIMTIREYADPKANSASVTKKQREFAMIMVSLFESANQAPKPSKKLKLPHVKIGGITIKGITAKDLPKAKKK
jgi:hypothetical protein